MKNTIRAAMVAALLLAPASIGARKDSGSNLWVNLGTLIDWSTLGAARTATVNGNAAQGLGLLTLYVEIEDADDSETGVSLACTTAHTTGGREYRIPACIWDVVNTRYSCEAGPLFWNPSDETAADIKAQIFRVDIENLRNATCVFSFTGGAAGDRIRVVGHAGVKG
jgi:hypothetical protein